MRAKRISSSSATAVAAAAELAPLAAAAAEPSTIFPLPKAALQRAARAQRGRRAPVSPPADVIESVEATLVAVKAEAEPLVAPRAAEQSSVLVPVKAEAEASVSPAAVPPKRAPRGKRAAPRGVTAAVAYEAAMAALTTKTEPLVEVTAAARPVKRKRGKAAAEPPAATCEALAPEVAAGALPVKRQGRGKAAKAVKAATAAAEAAALAAEVEDSKADGEKAGAENVEAAEEEAVVRKIKKRYYPKRRAVVKEEAGAEAEAVRQGEDAEEAGEGKKKPRRKKYDGPVFEIPGSEVLERALTAAPVPRPVPNLGYACLNMALREQRPPIYTNRDCIKKTLDERGLPWVSALALENARALAAIVQWNWEHNIHFFRLSSTILPWCTEYDVSELPDYAAIRGALKFAGDLARAYGQRLTFHPSHFVKLATADEALLCKSLKELEVHSQIMDMMGYEPSYWNKINIHVGGVYGDKVTSLTRFAAGFRRLSPACQQRLTVENDDIANSYSLEDLLVLHKDIRCPLVFDFHHHKFCPGSFTEEQALKAAVATWPPGVRPVVHWSESQEGRKAHAHSDFVDVRHIDSRDGPMNLHGLEADIDVMIEAKCKERALLRFRELAAAGPSADAVMASKMLDD